MTIQDKLAIVAVLLALGLSILQAARHGYLMGSDTPGEHGFFLVVEVLIVAALIVVLIILT